MKFEFSIHCIIGEMKTFSRALKVASLIVLGCLAIFMTPKWTGPDEQVKSKFEWIYAKRYWSNEGEGSGGGSTMRETEAARAILNSLIADYAVNSMLDAPCGSFHWMSQVISNVTRTRPTFRYHGVDVVESLVRAVESKYASYLATGRVEFSVCDISQQALPSGYELIFSRDALMHLSYEKVSNDFTPSYYYHYTFF